MRFFKKICFLLTGSLFFTCYSCNECRLPVEDAIAAHLTGDSIISYEVLHKEMGKDSGHLSFMAVVKDSSSQTVEKKGTIKFTKTGDGLWVFDSK